MSVEHAAALVCASLATYFIHSTLLLGVAWITTVKLQSGFDRISELTWRAALGLPIATALAQQFFSPNLKIGSATVGGIDYTPQPLTTSHVPQTLWIGVATIWIVGAALGLSRLYLCHRALRLQTRNKKPLPSDWLDLLAPVDGVDSVHISLIQDLAIPLALSREICLPAWVVDRLSVEELCAVVAHEAAHVRRHDAFWRSASAAVVRGLFFQPLNWVAADKLRELSECICDDEAVAAMKSPIPLAAALETVATRVQGRRVHLAYAPAMGGPVSPTLKRVGRILSSSPYARRRLEVRRLPLIGALVTAATLAVLFAPRVTLPSLAFLRYTINAEDPAGPFTVTVEKGHVVGATIAGRQLQSRQVRQNGASLELVDGTNVLSLRMTSEGGIRWNARKPITPPM